MTMTIPKLKTHSCSYSLRILLSLIAPHRDEIVPSAQVNQGMGSIGLSLLTSKVRGWPRSKSFRCRHRKLSLAQVVETSVTVNNSPIQDYVHPDDQTQPTFEMTPGFKPFTVL